jgi:fibronectin-binding autotransporter adhesin
MFLAAATGAVAMQLILAGAAFGQTWIDASGNWGIASNWSPATVPNSSSATATFTAISSVSDDVSLTGGPFTVGTLNLQSEVAGGFSFSDGTLQLAGPATINVQSHNPEADFTDTTTIVLQANATINTVFSDSTLTVAGTITDNGADLSLTKDGPGTLTLTGVNTFTGGTIVNAGTLQLGNGVNTASLAGGNGSPGSVGNPGGPGGAGTTAVTVNNSAILDVMANAGISGGAGGDGGFGGGGFNGGNGGNGGAAVSFSTGGSLTNSGTISGGAGGFGGPGFGFGGNGGNGGQLHRRYDDQRWNAPSRLQYGVESEFGVHRQLAFGPQR